MVSTTQSHIPHNSSESDFMTKDISWPYNFSLWRYQLATNIMRLDTIGLCLWGYAKDRVYADKSLTLEHLKINIRQVIAEIPSNMCQKVIENYLKESMLATLRVEVIEMM